MAGLLDLEEERRKNLAPINPRSIAGLLGTVGENPNARMMSMAQDYARNLPQQLAINQAAMDKAIGGWNRTDFATGQANPNYYPEAVSELTQLMPNMAGMIAYHGTPHNILGKFDISKVGTGEGAQAYGHGMYFAENPVVAEGYKNALSNPEIVLQSGKRISSPATGTPEDVAKAWLEEAFLNKIENPIEHSIQKLIKLKNAANNPKQFEQAVNVLEDWKKQGATVDLGGNLYKVDIPDEYIPNMLDWDKPLLEQSKPVQEALAKLGIKTDAKKLNEFDDALLNALMGDASNPLPKQPINPTGADIYQRFIQGNPELTSKKLNEAGIKGIRYLDEGSRGNYRAQTTYKGEPYSDMLSFKTKGQLDDFIKEKEAEGFGVNTFPQTSNFVVFDPSTVKILEKNKKKVGLLD